MGRDHYGDGPRNAPGPMCACCGQPYAEDIGGEEIHTVPFGGFVSLQVCETCLECPLGGPCECESTRAIQQPSTPEAGRDD